MEPVSADDSQVLRVAKSTLEKLLASLDITATVVLKPHPDENEEARETESAPIAFNIIGDDLGILIGRRGQTLSCLQFLLRLIVGHQTKRWIPITVDVEDYRERRAEKLRALAERLAEQVSNRRSPFTMEPMLAYERRIIHLALADHPGVYTESTGEGDSRKVVIRPQKR